MRNINNGLNGLNGYYFQGVHLSQVHQPRSVPTKQENGLNGFTAAWEELTTDLSD